MFNLPILKYDFKALEPHIDEVTMQIHHGRHHQTYVDNLNKALEGKEDLQLKRLEELISRINALPEDIRNSVRNNGGGHWNHSFFWEILTDKESDIASQTKLEEAINSTFGLFDNFKEEFKKAALSRFGSGWVWVVKTDGNKLKILSTPNQDNPLMDVSELKGTPILGLDVWEHAYYLKYQNKRADYIDSFWNVVNWERVGELFA